MQTFQYNSFEEYKNTQIERHKSTYYRTINRTTRKLDIQTIKNIQQISSILCVGCRDDSEVQDFINAGFVAQGVDLLQQTSLIKQCDMHDLCNFYDVNQFDLLYFSHSLEHAYNVKQVLLSALSIAKYGIYIVLPFMNEPNAKDCSVFKFMHLWSELTSEIIQKEINDLLTCDNIVVNNLLIRNEIVFILQQL